MPDLLVKLYDLNFDAHQKECFNSETRIVRAMALDKSKVVDFVRTEFSEIWANECERSFSKQPASCFVAIKNNRVIGFACYDVTARGYLGPIGVQSCDRKRGTGTELLFSCLKDMWENEYGYAIVGWVTDDAIDFYKTTVSATVIPDSHPGIYKRMVDVK